LKERAFSRDTARRAPHASTACNPEQPVALTGGLGGKLLAQQRTALMLLLRLLWLRLRLL
jgi:hypothetical protein